MILNKRIFVIRLENKQQMRLIFRPAQKGSTEILSMLNKTDTGSQDNKK